MGIYTVAPDNVVSSCTSRHYTDKLSFAPPTAFTHALLKKKKVVVIYSKLFPYEWECPFGIDSKTTWAGHKIEIYLLFTWVQRQSFLNSDVVGRFSWQKKRQLDKNVAHEVNFTQTN
jgi:hypothetical protein